jgi:hypothetical protein
MRRQALLERRELMEARRGQPQIQVRAAVAVGLDQRRGRLEVSGMVDHQTSLQFPVALVAAVAENRMFPHITAAARVGQPADMPPQRPVALV